MSKCPMQGHFRYLSFKTFPMTPRTRQCKVFWVLLSSSEHSGVPEDSKSQLFQVLGFTPTLGQVRVATKTVTKKHDFNFRIEILRPRVVSYASFGCDGHLCMHRRGETTIHKRRSDRLMEIVVLVKPQATSSFLDRRWTPRDCQSAHTDRD
jgi:hypothetical protein